MVKFVTLHDRKGEVMKIRADKVQMVEELNDAPGCPAYVRTECGSWWVKETVDEIEKLVLEALKE